MISSLISYIYLSQPQNSFVEVNIYIVYSNSHGKSQYNYNITYILTRFMLEILLSIVVRLKISNDLV